MLGEQTFEGRRENLSQANKLSRTYAVLLDGCYSLTSEDQSEGKTRREASGRVRVALCLDVPGNTKLAISMWTRCLTSFGTVPHGR
jgi:hypothetical protein